ncbi:MAG: CPBP family intramembrane metalloprotease [Solobacterium sp.]|nr:CPBP family intramembrane metalloprotease [Solobacterium sp.]
MEIRKEHIRTVLAALLAVIITYSIYKIGGALVRGRFANYFIECIVTELFYVIPTIIAVILLKKQSIYHSDPSILKKNWTCALLMIGIILINFFLTAGFFSVLAAEGNLRITEVLLTLVFCMMIGYAEEVNFRGLLQNAFHDLFTEKNPRSVLAAITCSSFLFGFMHIFNAFRPDVIFSAALRQAITAMVVGMYLSAIYYRTGKNLWFSIILHGFNDFVVMRDIYTGGSVSDTINAGSVSLASALLGIGVFVGMTLIILRPKKLAPLLDHGDEDTRS